MTSSATSTSFDPNCAEALLWLRHTPPKEDRREPDSTTLDQSPAELLLSLSSDSPSPKEQADRPVRTVKPSPSWDRLVKDEDGFYIPALPLKKEKPENTPSSSKPDILPDEDEAERLRKVRAASLATNGSAFRTPAPKRKVTAMESPRAGRSPSPTLSNGPPYPDLQPPSDPSQVKEYFRRLGMNTVWKNQQAELESLTTDKGKKERLAMSKFMESEEYQRVFGKKRKPNSPQEKETAL